MGSEPPDALCHPQQPTVSWSQPSERKEFAAAAQYFFNKLHSALWLLSLQPNPLHRPHTDHLSKVSDRHV